MLSGDAAGSRSGLVEHDQYDLVVFAESLETERLRLRQPAVTDAEDVYQNYAADPEVTRYLTWRCHQDVSETVAVLEHFHRAWDGQESIPWAIEAKDTGEVIGMIEARPAEVRVEVAYVLSRACWGQGLMTEAVSGVTTWAFEQGDVWRVWAIADTENLASCRVLEKAGMQREGRLHRWGYHPNVSTEPRDVWCYAAWR